MSRVRVSPVHGVETWRLLIKGTLAGKAAAALRRQRRAPVAAARSWRAARRDGPPPPAASRSGSAAYVVCCGPGEMAALSDTIDSIQAYDDDARILVVEDATQDVRWPLVRRRHPGVDVVRWRWPTGGPPRLYPPLAFGLRQALERYDFDVLCQLDTDAVLTGPGLPEAAAARLAAEPSIGLLGTVGLRADGVPEDYTYDEWVLAHERRWSPTVRRVEARARAAGYTGAKVHGGFWVAGRRALEALRAAGYLDTNPPWWTLINDDHWITMAVYAAGYRIASWGAPGDPTASASKFLPVPLDEIESRGVLAVHSVRRGFSGEPEQVVRATLRARRPRREGG
jgi:hypothetical protein